MLLHEDRSQVATHLNALGFAFVRQEGWVARDGHTAIIGWCERSQKWRGAHTRPKAEDQALAA